MGLSYLGINNEEDDRKIVNRWIIDSLKANPRLWFSGEGIQVRDPRVQTEDLGNNAVKAAEYGIKNLKRVMARLPEWTKEEGDVYENLNHMYGAVADQFSRYVGHVTKNISGVYETRKSIEQDGYVYAPTPKAIQKEALAFLNKNVFDNLDWLADKNIANKIRFVPSGVIFSLISKTMDELVGRESRGQALLNLEANANRFPDADNYSPAEMLNDLKAGVFAELTTKKTISVYRRIAQREYVRALKDYTRLRVPIGGENSPVSIDYSASDVSTIVRSHLVQLKKEIDAAIPGMPDKMSKDHLQDLSLRIKQALERKEN